MLPVFKCRQIDKYDGQYVYSSSKVVYELGNYLGGGASGSVYQAVETAESSNNGREKQVAIKILNPLGYKNTVLGQLNKCSIAVKGSPFSQEQIVGKTSISIENVWWLIHPSSKVIFAAYEDPHRCQLRELPLPKCVEVWGLNPLNINEHTDLDIEKLNVGNQIVIIDNNTKVRIPVVSPKYLKFLKSRESVCREMANMIHVGEHPNLIKLGEVLELIQDTKTTLFLVLELTNGGELFDRIKSGDLGCHKNSEEFGRKYFRQLLSGIDYCHKKGVVHRDLKPENLLLSDPSDSAILKIADFGLSAVIFASNTKVMPGRLQSALDDSATFTTLHTPPPKSAKSTYHSSSSAGNLSLSGPNSAYSNSNSHLSGYDISAAELRRLNSVVGSPYYIAPEVSNQEQMGYDGRKVDMWSAGIILYSLLTGSLPFGGDLIACPRFKRYKQWLCTDYAQAIRERREVALPQWFWPSHISPPVGSLLVSLLHFDPNMRLTAEEALNHPWCRQVDSDFTSADMSFVSKPSIFRLNQDSSAHGIFLNMSSQDINAIRDIEFGNRSYPTSNDLSAEELVAIQLSIESEMMRCSLHDKPSGQSSHLFSRKNVNRLNSSNHSVKSLKRADSVAPSSGPVREQGTSCTDEIHKAVTPNNSVNTTPDRSPHSLSPVTSTVTSFAAHPHAACNNPTSHLVISAVTESTLSTLASRTTMSPNHSESSEIGQQTNFKSHPNRTSGNRAMLSIAEQQRQKELEAMEYCSTNRNSREHLETSSEQQIPYSQNDRIGDNEDSDTLPEDRLRIPHPNQITQMSFSFSSVPVVTSQSHATRANGQIDIANNLVIDLSINNSSYEPSMRDTGRRSNRVNES